jgi:hypothetical protein
MEEIAMPVFIPKPEEQVTYFQGVLEHGEQVQAAFWCEQRLFWLVHWLIEELPLGEIIFMSLRHRYFAALTDRRLILMGSSGMHKPIPGKLESLQLPTIQTTNFRKWLGGGISLDLMANGTLRRFKVPRSQRAQAEAVRSLGAA